MCDVYMSVGTLVCVMCVYMLCIYVCEVYEYVCSSYRENGRSSQRHNMYVCEVYENVCSSERENGRSSSRHKLPLLLFPYNCDYISKNKKGILRVGKRSYWRLSFLLLNCGG